MAATKKSPGTSVKVQRLVGEILPLCWKIEDAAKAETLTAKGRSALHLANLLRAVTDAAKKPDGGMALAELASRVDGGLLDVFPGRARNAPDPREDLRDRLVERVGALRSELKPKTAAGLDVFVGRAVGAVLAWVRNESAGLGVPPHEDRRWRATERYAREDLSPRTLRGRRARESDVSIVNACLRALGVETDAMGARARMKKVRAKASRNR